MAIYRNEMDISVTAFKQRCLDIIRRVETRGEPVTITRRGKFVARLGPAPGGPKGAGKLWQRLRAMGGRCDFAAEESVLRERDLKALRCVEAVAGHACLVVRRNDSDNPERYRVLAAPLPGSQTSKP